jgi:hypothetical protein
MFQLFSHGEPSDWWRGDKESGIGYGHVLFDEFQRRGLSKTKLQSIFWKDGFV